LDGQEHWTIVRQGRGWLMLAVTCQDGALVVGSWPQVIPLDWTPCHFGGTRPWLRCPRCARRQAVLYSRATVLLCRPCLRLPYASRGTTAEDRLYQQADKLRKRLGASRTLSDPISPRKKPKGMHWRGLEPGLGPQTGGNLRRDAGLAQWRVA